LRKLEQLFWRNRVRPWLVRNQIVYDRVESDATAPGIPDIHICTAAGSGWIELKIAKVDLCRSEFSMPTLTPHQVSWMQGRYQLSRRVWVLAHVPDIDMEFFFRASELKHLIKCDLTHAVIHNSRALMELEIVVGPRKLKIQNSRADSEG